MISDDVRLIPSIQTVLAAWPKLNCSFTGDSVAGATKLAVYCCHPVESVYVLKPRQPYGENICWIPAAIGRAVELLAEKVSV